MADNLKFYLLHNGTTVLARVHGLFQAEMFKGGAWHPANHVARTVTGMGGDTDYTEITEDEARRRFPEAFGT